MKKKSRKLTPAQARIFRRGLARGKVLAADALTRKRRAAARKAAETRKKHPKEKKPPAEALTVLELALYEAPDAEGVPILSGLSFAEWAEPTAWEAKVELWVEGEMVHDGELSMAAEWDNEAAAKLIRREIRSWYEDAISKHPEWAESPAATLVRLSLRRT